MAMHPFDRWMRTAGRREAYGWEPTLALFRSYCRFCEATGERREGGVQAFCRCLDLYLVPQRRKRGRGWRGFELRSSR
jgi:hypothetical protein